jgi:Outer membrane cytochrome MtrC/MtrF-like, domains II/IV
MKPLRTVPVGLAVLTAVLFQARPVLAADTPPYIQNLSKAASGEMEIIFYGGTGPFRIERNTSFTPSPSWADVAGASVTELRQGVYRGLIPNGAEDLAFFRVVSESDGIAELKGWTILANVSAPANGAYFVPGESPVVTVTLLDTFTPHLTSYEFSTLNLYLYGPQDPQKTVTAVKLLNASTNRAVRPHHYIDLKTNPDVQVNGGVLTYRLQPVTDEAPGTYTLSVYSVMASDAIQQIMKFTDLQIGTGLVESPVVAKRAPDGSPKCASCHEGPVSGKTYMHHIDPSGSPGSVGSWSLDYEPTRSCKSCHNNDGYAAYRDASAPGGRVSDTIMRRVHGIHMGADLKLPFNTNSVDGSFADYIHVEFPADVRNCTQCHLDDRWKTEPTRVACTTCHDNVWFGDPGLTPIGMKNHAFPLLDNHLCGFCHPPDTGGFVWTNGLDVAVASAHAIPQEFEKLVELVMTPPANSKFYVTGESPQLTIKFQRLDTNGTPTGVYIDPAAITTATWNRVRLQVSGPRAFTLPALTSASSDHSLSGSSSYIYNDLRLHPGDPASDDPRATRTADSIVYQLETITNSTAGTYTVFVQARETAVTDLNVINFQVGTATPEMKVATSCVDCHADTKMHGSYPFNTDLCKSCHDYERQLTGRTGWLDSNWGFGAAPLSRRVHGVHFGNYLDKPEEIHGVADAEAHFGHIVFPMDIRNCTKCHSESPTWTEKPSRLACLACHDSDAATVHANLMTYDPTPADPWSGDEWESCIVCHGEEDDYSPRVVHSIADPYVPPYPRAQR